MSKPGMTKPGRRSFGQALRGPENAAITARRPAELGRVGTDR